VVVTVVVYGVVVFTVGTVPEYDPEQPGFGVPRIQGNL